MEKNITLLKGDGIGPEIVDQAVKVLDAVAKKYGAEVIDINESCHLIIRDERGEIRELSSGEISVKPI